MVKLHPNGYKFGAGVGQVSHFRLFRKLSKIKGVYKVGKGIYYLIWFEGCVGVELILLTNLVREFSIYGRANRVKGSSRGDHILAKKGILPRQLP